ncbi:MAG: dicarboxylate/amino acid:cation symporter [Bacteroidia bacterium]|nr:dicarboxylate/amino acid:cation symporter [Bacteroidia bacterium]
MSKPKLPLHIKILIGLGLGITWAVISTMMGWNRFTLDWVLPFGKIFISLLKLIAVPLVLFSIIKGIVDLKDVSRLGRLGMKTLLIYLSTTILAVTLGLTLANLLKPGGSEMSEQRILNRMSYELWVEATEGVNHLDGHSFLHDPQYAALAERARSMAQIQPDNKLQERMKQAEQSRQSGPLKFLEDIIPENLFFTLSNNGLMLQVIFFALFFGMVLLQIPQSKSLTLITVIEAINDVFLKMVDVVMKGAPFFVFALMAGKTAEMIGDSPDGLSALGHLFSNLLRYSLTVVIGLALVLFVVYPLIMILLTGKKLGMNPMQAYRWFFRSMSPAQFLAFSTSSSAATLPVTMECVRDNLKVSKEVTSFVLPIGATVNMDGTSLYQAIAVIFLAQFHMVDLTLAQQLTIVLTATLASIGSAAIPSAGLIMLIIVLQSVGLNPAWIAIIFPVDRILDMCRTVVNVTGDAMVATVIETTERKSNGI